ncbi:Na+/H+ antiporter NhaC family protein [Photobacterium iliopiscarium]|uniref:Na+/H+ antiporter NhaC family protein n=1 Tax=Photobacterium iliopiscarium TaxID=56192 RepID=UPI000AA92C10|nr:Na+/H+ antiporter NhaC family protein [Photobacterium iliopiscarium]
MIGAIINVMKQSGGIDTLIYQLVYKRNIVKSKGSAQLITIAFGFLMCLEGVGSMMLIGLVGRPLFNQFDISREKLAFIANCTGAPLAWLMPFSGAGIFLASLIAVQVENGTLDKPPMYYVLAALPYQIYTMAILALVLLLALKQHDFTAQSTSANQVNIVPSSDHQPQTSILAIILPVAILLASILVITYVTRDISSAVYWSGFISLIGSGIYFRVCKVNINQYVEWCVKGMENMLPAAIILTLAFSLSGITGELGTGKYLASFVSNEVPIWLVPASIFVICVLISFSTGSSGATVSIMTPIIIPLAVSIGISVPLVIATVISGAVFRLIGS